MISILLSSTFMIIIPLMLMLLSIFLSKKSIKNHEKSMPFECGFDPLSLNRPPFSIQFFMISMMFLIFDIEIALLIPLVILTSMFSMTVVLTSIFFLMILLMGLFYEYTEKSMEWKF